MLHTLTEVINTLVILVISLSFHEAAHAFVATWQGDNTAKDEGRLTLNPVPHIDPFGTLILPGIMLLFSATSGAGFVFGWAKPVPVNPSNFRNKRWGDMMVSAAGPISNLILSFLGIFIYEIWARNYTGGGDDGSFSIKAMKLLVSFSYINAILAFLNLLPLPPLDGSYILKSFLSYDLKQKFEQYITPYAFIIFIVLLMTNSLYFLSVLAFYYVHLAKNITQFLLFS